MLKSIKKNYSKYSNLIMEEELFKLLDVELNILSQRLYETHQSQERINLEDGIKKLVNLKRIIINLNYPIEYKDFKKYINYIFETVEISLNNLEFNNN